MIFAGQIIFVFMFFLTPMMVWAWLMGAFRDRASGIMTRRHFSRPLFWFGTMTVVGLFAFG